MTERKVLLIDDNCDLGVLLGEILSEDGIDFRYAGTHAEAYKLIAEGGFDTIILDGSLGSGGQVDTLGILRRAKKRSSASKIIGFSGLPESNQVLCAHGADTAVPKARFDLLLRELKK